MITTGKLDKRNWDNRKTGQRENGGETGKQEKGKTIYNKSRMSRSNKISLKCSVASLGCLGFF